MKDVVLALIALNVVTVAWFLVLLADLNRRQLAERARMLSAIVARTPADFATLTAERKTRTDDEPVEPKALVGTE